MAGAFAEVYAAQRTQDAVDFYQTRIVANEEQLATISTDLAAQEDIKRQLVAERNALFDDAPSEARAAQLEQKATEISQVQADIGVLDYARERWP